MKPSLKNENLPVWCEKCNKQGYIFVRSLEDDTFVFCEACGWESSFVTCKTAEVGGDIVKNLDQRPAEWKCDDCGSTHRLPKDFYSKPARIYFEDELPPEVASALKGQYRTDFSIPPDVRYGIAGIVVAAGMYYLQDLFTSGGYNLIGPIVAILMMARAKVFSMFKSPSLPLRLLPLGMIVLACVLPAYHFFVPRGPIMVVNIASSILFGALAFIAAKTQRS